MADPIRCIVDAKSYELAQVLEWKQYDLIAFNSKDKLSPHSVKFNTRMLRLIAQPLQGSIIRRHRRRRQGGRSNREGRDDSAQTLGQFSCGSGNLLECLYLDGHTAVGSLSPIVFSF